MPHNSMDALRTICSPILDNLFQVHSLKKFNRRQISSHLESPKPWRFQRGLIITTGIRHCFCRFSLSRHKMLSLSPQDSLEVVQTHLKSRSHSCIFEYMSKMSVWITLTRLWEEPPWKLFGKWSIKRGTSPSFYHVWSPYIHGLIWLHIYPCATTIISSGVRVAFRLFSTFRPICPMPFSGRIRTAHPDWLAQHTTWIFALWPSDHATMSALPR